MFQQLNEDDGLTIILVTHDANVAKFAQRLIHIRDGAISNGSSSHDDGAEKGSGSFYPEHPEGRSGRTNLTPALLLENGAGI